MRPVQNLDRINPISGNTDCRHNLLSPLSISLYTSQPLWTYLSISPLSLSLIHLPSLSRSTSLASQPIFPLYPFPPSLFWPSPLSISLYLSPLLTNVPSRPSSLSTHLSPLSTYLSSLPISTSLSLLSPSPLSIFLYLSPLWTHLPSLPISPHSLLTLYPLDPSFLTLLPYKLWKLTENFLFIQ